VILYRPDEHEPLASDPWDEARVREAIAGVVAAAERALPPDGLWPAHPHDLEGDEEGPFTVIYLGAAGVAWALGQLGSAIDTDAVAERAHAAYVERADSGKRVPGGPFGEGGILRVLGDRERLEACVRANARNETLEWLWGAPGTMIAAEALPDLDDAWRESAEALWEAWDGEVWTQHLYGRVDQLLGAGHGFVGNVRALAGRPDLLGEERTAELGRRAVRVLAESALVEDGLANWSPVLGRPEPEKIRVQWCHGAPGVITSTAALATGDEAFTELLVAGGELTWRAGPIRKGPSLCHGTAGNGYAFLKLFGRTGDERWLERARAFAMHAIGQLDGARFSLWTGDVGVALYLRACLDGDDRFPTIDRW
jgi:hypothetical protein